MPDERLDHLAALYASERIVPATVTFMDIAGIVRGASEGEGLGNKFLAAIRETDAICQVVRAFDDDDVIHVDGGVDPADDIATVNTELILADLQTVDNRLTRLAKEARMQPELGAQLVAVRRRPGRPGPGPDHLGRRRAGGPWTRPSWPTCTC